MTATLQRRVHYRLACSTISALPLFLLASHAMTEASLGEQTEPARSASSSSSSRSMQAGPRVGSPGTERPSATPATPIQVYRASCLECHDSDGRGDATRDVLPKIPDFTSSSWQTSRTDADLRRSILDGKGKLMPRMKDKLGSVDVVRMVAFVRAFRDGKQVVEDEAEGPSGTGRESTANAVPSSPSAVGPSRSIRSNPEVQAGSRDFQRLCVKCHSADGKGASIRESLPTLPDFTDARWQRRRTNAQLVVSVLDGKGDVMPQFRDKLSPEQAKALVRFIRTFSSVQIDSSETAPDEFEAQFQRLTREMEDLRRRVRALSASPR
jgi:mono/diheme cytochrome c family protein